ncbi:MAG: YhdT family protein [Eubacteriales bacterium]|nr:YhdT family protein [Eubacteriales bacterium]
MRKMTREEKERQIHKEAKATLILFAVCFVWHVGFAYGLSGRVSVRILSLPLWWWLSVPGVFAVAVIGVVFLLKKVFVNFSLEDDDFEDDSEENKEGGRA